MGNTGLLKARGRDDPTSTSFRGYETPRTQEFALLAFLVVQVSVSQGGRRLPPQNAPLKMLRVLDPIKISPFVVPTIRKEAPTGNAPMEATPFKAVTNRFPQVRGNRISDSKGRFRPHSRGRGRGNPSPQ